MTLLGLEFRCTFFSCTVEVADDADVASTNQEVPIAFEDTVEVPQVDRVAWFSPGTLEVSVLLLEFPLI